MLKKILIGASVTIGAGLVIAATGWNFLATANMGEKFVLKSDFDRTFTAFAECNEKDHDRIKDKLDKIYDILIDHYRPTVRSTLDFDEINNENNILE